MSLPVYSRADLSRIVTLVVALFLTAVSTSAVAREFRAADIRSDDRPTVQAPRDAGYYTFTEPTMSPEVPVMSRKAWESLSPDDRRIVREAAARSSRFMREKWRYLEERSRRQAEAAGLTVVTDFDRKPFEAAMAGIYATAQRDPAAAQPIERIRKVE